MASHFKPFGAQGTRNRIGIDASAGRLRRFIASLAFALLSFTDGMSIARGDDAPPLDRLETDVAVSMQWAAPALDARSLLIRIEAWLSTEFGLPKSGVLPRIELVPPAKMVGLRYHGLLPE